jgi:hypothetical protein
MTGRRITAGLSVLCALVFCAFSASSASAAGTTAFECVKDGGALDYSDAACATFVGAGNGEYGHVALVPKTPAKVELTGAEAKLMGTVGGITTTLKATGFKGVSTTCENTEAETRMVQKCHLEGEFTEATLTEGPPGCKLVGSTIKLVGIDSVTKEMVVEFKPTVTNLAEFKFEGCNTMGLNTTYKLIGTFKGIPSGVNINFTEASTGSLKFAGQAAFLIATLVTKMESGSALRYTTTLP